MDRLPILLRDEVAACPGAALPTDEAEPLDICLQCARLAAFARAHAAGGAVRGVIPAAVVIDGQERCVNRSTGG